MDPNKYIAFKSEDWAKFRADDTMSVQDFEDSCRIPDAVVLRGQDAFTPGVLFAYANNVTTTTEIIEALIEDSPELQLVLKNLRYVADQFHEMASYSTGLPAKLPD